METFRIRAESEPLDDPSAWADRNEAVVDALAHAGVGDVVGWAGFPRVGAVFAVEAGDVGTAAARGARIFGRALRTAGVGAKTTYLEVGGEPDEEDEPALVGATDVARILGVSRQRVYQLAASATFPETIAHLARGAMWRRRDIEEWQAARSGARASS
jgi:predicted DNA-binding transcriptional regulator AlpA